jgi:hypothetical protein
MFELPIDLTEWIERIDHLLSLLKKERVEKK